MSQKPVSMIRGTLMALIVVLVGISIATLLAVRKIPPLLGEADRGILPTGFEVVLPSAGDYTVWLHLSGRLANKLYQGSGELPPGGKVFLFDAASGQEIPLMETVTAEKNMGEDRAVSLGVFQAERDEQMIEVKGAGLNMPILISVSHASSRQIMGVVLLISLIVLSSMALGLLVFVKSVKGPETTP